MKIEYFMNYNAITMQAEFKTTDEVVLATIEDVTFDKAHELFVFWCETTRGLKPTNEGKQNEQ